MKRIFTAFEWICGSRFYDEHFACPLPWAVQIPRNWWESEILYFYDKYQFLNIVSVEKVIPEYIRFRNESKGQWARYGKNASAVLKDAEAKPLTDEELERVIWELYFEKT